MDYRQALVNCKEIIINDLRGDIFELFKPKMTEDDFNAINDLDTPIRKRNEKFFEILLGMTNQTIFNEFLSMLEEHYWWITQDLRQEVQMLENERKFRDEEEPMPHDRSMSEKILHELGVPLYQMSELYVDRIDMSNRLNNEIQKLKPGMFLVLHGMSGSGKSSLVIDTLKDHNLLSNHLMGKVFWIFGLKTIDDILKSLYHLISDTPFEGEWDLFRCQAQISQKLKEKNLENALIVFDGVVSSEFIQFLNYNCKKLIITHNENIVFSDPSSHVNRIKIDTYLSEKEALKLFSQAANVNLTDLPVEAKEIIRLTKGFPFLLHMFAKKISQNRNHNSLWKQITNMLATVRKGHGKGSLDFLLTTLYPVFDCYLEELTAEKQPYYEMFAVFTNDVNLKVEVFTTVWSMNHVAVINLLDEFENKSLIGKKSNPAIKGYVYGIHDVLLFYLRNRMKDNLKVLHGKLIDKYYEKCKGEFWNLEIDNYIHIYLGYHLERAGRVDLFKLFVNLLFVNAKIKAAGATDLLNDYEKYHEYINTEDNQQIFGELKDFVKHYGHILQQSDDVDIIQLGLQQREKSAIFKAAVALAKKQPEKIFLNFQPKHKLVDDDSDSLSFKTPKNVNAVCFSDQHNIAFLANEDGSINRKRLERNFFSQNSFLYGHKESVVSLALSPDERYLLSVSKDLEVRIWDLLMFDNSRFNFNGTLKGNDSPSPPLRQQSYSPVFQNGLLTPSCDGIIQGYRHHQSPLTCCQFSPNSEYVVICSEDKRISIWQFETSISRTKDIKHLRSLETSSVPRCCAFSSDGKTVLVGCDNRNIKQITVKPVFGSKDFQFDSAIKRLHSVVGVNGTHPPVEGTSNFVLVLSNRVEVIRIENSYSRVTASQNGNNQNYEVLCSWPFRISQGNFITRSWVPANGSFIAITTSSHCVSLYNLANGHLQREYLYESSQEVIGIDLKMDANNSYMLVLCRNDRLHVEKVELSPNEQASKFCVAPNWGEDEPTIVVPCINGFKVIQGGLKRPFDLNTNVTSCHIDDSAMLVVIGTDCGTVLLFDLESDYKKSIMEFRDCNRNPSLVVLVRVYLLGNETLVIGINNEHLIKISFKATVIEYQARHKIKGVWFSPDSKKLIMLCLNQEIKVWNVLNNLEIAASPENQTEENLFETAEEVLCCDMSTRNMLVIATSSMIKLLNVDDMNVSQTILNQPANCCSFSSDGSSLVFGFKDGTIQIYDVINEQLHIKQQTNVNCKYVISVCVGNGGQVFGALSQRRIYLGKLLNDEYRFACTELSAQHLIKAAEHHIFLTIDKRSQIYKVTFFDSFDSLDNSIGTLSSNRTSSRPKLTILKIKTLDHQH